ncbi:MAG TPA: hypothetical protein P5107_00120 [Thermotogota bacterium]|nr:hypothetical protein [Thermotogota bacterium]HRW33442.1 hypothetical protein [Thermotogota bacterium]
MRWSKWTFIFLVVFSGIIFIAWEFFVTSRMSLDVLVIYPAGISDDVGFQMKVYSFDFSDEKLILPHDEAIHFSNMPFGDYFFELTLDDRLLIKEFHNFQSGFSFKRTKETVTLDVTELASIASISYKIVDPYLTIKWNGKYMGAFRPTDYLIGLNGREQVLSVNYVEMDVLKELLEGEDTVIIDIIPLTQSGGKLLSYEYEIPIRMESVSLDIPKGFNVYDMSMSIQEKRIPIDPYNPIINFPVIDFIETTIPFEIYYYEDRIWKSEINLSATKDLISLPSIPQATVSHVELSDATVTLYLDLEKDEEFLYNRFKHFIIQQDTLSTTCTERFTYSNNHQQLQITPLFEPDIQGDALLFEIPEPPFPQFHTFMLNEDLQFAPSIKVYSESFLPLNGMLRVDNSVEINLPDFSKEYFYEANFNRDEVHLIEVILEDVYGQQAQKAKWISTAVPETTFFTKYELNENQILSVEWDELMIYDRIELIVTDDYNIKRFNPEGASLQADLSRTLLRQPLRVILKGYLNDEEYTAAVIEGIKTE